MGKVISVVFNTSPIIFLIKLGYFKQAINLFDSCIIPVAVKDELYEKKNTVASIITNLQHKKMVITKHISHIHIVDGLSTRLGKGEAEAIALAIEIDADYIILDDYVARNEAKRLGLNVKGTLGIIYRLINENKLVINNYEDFYNRLIGINFRIKKEIFYKIFE